jgi:hypothetical protein
MASIMAAVMGNGGEKGAVIMRVVARWGVTRKSGDEKGSGEKAVLIDWGCGSWVLAYDRLPDVSIRHWTTS